MEADRNKCQQPPTPEQTQGHSRKMTFFPSYAPRLTSTKIDYLTMPDPCRSKGTTATGVRSCPSQVALEVALLRKRHLPPKVVAKPPPLLSRLHSHSKHFRLHWHSQPNTQKKCSAQYSHFNFTSPTFPTSESCQSATVPLQMSSAKGDCHSGGHSVGQPSSTICKHCKALYFCQTLCELLPAT